MYFLNDIFLKLLTLISISRIIIPCGEMIWLPWKCEIWPDSVVITFQCYIMTSLQHEKWINQCDICFAHISHCFWMFSSCLVLLLLLFHHQVVDDYKIWAITKKHFPFSQFFMIIFTLSCNSTRQTVSYMKFSIIRNCLQWYGVDFYSNWV